MRLSWRGHKLICTTSADESLTAFPLGFCCLLRGFMQTLRHFRRPNRRPILGMPTLPIHHSSARHARCAQARVWAAFIGVCLTAVIRVHASYGIYVGKNLTADGSVFLAGYGDEPSSHWLDIVPQREWPTGATIKVGATAASQYPGILIDIPQVRSTAKEHTLDHSCFAGFHP